MPQLNELSNVRVKAISLVTKGANRKRFYLLKSGEDEAPEAPLHDLPAPGKLLKAAEGWTTAYCVVAEPGWIENAGQAGDPSLGDVWASDEEIAKAAHEFLKSSGLINRMHESLDPYGDLAESFIAPCDFDVDGDTIRKGSWVVGIHPNADGIAKITAGEWTGVSLEGSGTRTLVEKAAAKQRRGGGSVPRVSERLKSVLRKLGASPDDLADLDVVKADTFAEIWRERQIDEELPAAFDAFRSAVWRAFWAADDDEDAVDPAESIATSADEFKAWLLDMLDRAPVEVAKREVFLKVSREDANAEGQTAPSATVADMDAAERAQIVKEVADEVKSSLDPAAIGQAIAKAQAEAEAESQKPTLESVAESVSKLDEKVTKIANGKSSQKDDNGEPVEKSDGPTKDRPWVGV